jgi:hypothetical protein
VARGNAAAGIPARDLIAFGSHGRELRLNRVRFISAVRMNLRIRSAAEFLCLRGESAAFSLYRPQERQLTRQ